jgi:hypothetical protein
MLPGYFNVKSYGALGDGSTDDTSAIQDAIDACDDGGGGVVWLPPGTYRVDNLSIPTQAPPSGFPDDVCLVSVMGAGRGSSILKSNGSNPILAINSGDFFRHSGFFAGFEVDGNSSASTGIQLYQGTCSDFRDLHIHHCTKGIDFTGSNTINARNLLLDYNGTGLYATKTASGEPNLFNFNDVACINNTSWGMDWVYGSVINLIGCGFEVNGTTANASTGAMRLTTSANNGEKIIGSCKGCYFERNKGGGSIILATAGAAGHFSIYDTLLAIFSGATDGDYGVKVGSNITLITQGMSAFGHAVKDVSLDAGGVWRKGPSSYAETSSTGSGTVTTWGET